MVARAHPLPRAIGKFSPSTSSDGTERLIRKQLIFDHLAARLFDQGYPLLSIEVADYN